MNSHMTLNPYGICRRRWGGYHYTAIGYLEMLTDLSEEFYLRIDSEPILRGDASVYCYSITLKSFLTGKEICIQEDSLEECLDVIIEMDSKRDKPFLSQEQKEKYEPYKISPPL